MTEIIKINPLKPEPHLIRKAWEILKNSGIIGYPTDTVYGLGANALDEKAIKKIFSLKGREISKPLLLVISKEFNLKEIVTEVPSQAVKLIKAFWPGPLTLVLKANNKIPSILTAGTGKVGIRVPDNLITLSLLSLCKFPVTSTSANPSGMLEAKTAEEVRNYFVENLDLIIDGGECCKAIPSTIVDFTKGRFKIIREGKISSDMVANVLTN